MMLAQTLVLVQPERFVQAIMLIAVCALAMYALALWGGGND